MTIDGVLLVIGFIEHLKIVVTASTVALSLIHTLCNTLQYALSLLSLLFFANCLITAFKDLASSASMFTSSLAVTNLTTNSALLRNILHLGLLRLPRLYQGLLSDNSLRLGLDCLAADSL
jgi:hypothetical protein